MAYGDDFAPIIRDDEWRAHQAAQWATKTDDQIKALPSLGWDLSATRQIQSIPFLSRVDTAGMPNQFTDGSEDQAPQSWDTRAQQQIDSLPLPSTRSIADEVNPDEAMGNQPVGQRFAPTPDFQSYQDQAQRDTMRSSKGPVLDMLDDLQNDPTAGRSAAPLGGLASKAFGATQDFTDRTIRSSTDQAVNDINAMFPSERPYTAENLEGDTALAMGASGGIENPGRLPEKALTRLASTDLPASAKAIANTAAQEVERLRLDKFPEDVRPLIQQAAESMGFAQGQRRGVISDAAAEGMADQAGRTVEDWLRTGKAGRAYNTEEIRALGNAVNAQAEKVRQAVEAHASAGIDASDRMLADVLTQGERLQALTALREGARAEAGRSLRAFQANTRAAEQPAEQVARIFKAVGGRDNALAAVSEYQTMLESGATPVQQAQFWAKIEQPPVNAVDWFKALRYNAMLSGPRTWEVNVISNALEVPWRGARDVAASVGRAATSGSLTPLREIPAEVKGAWVGAVKGADALMQTLAHGITEEQALRGELPQDIASRVQNPVAKGAAHGLEFTGRILQGFDEFARQTAYGMSIYRDAAKAATAKGLKGQAWSDAVAELASNPDRALIQRAMGVADRMTFQGDMGQFGRGLSGFTNQAGIAGHIILPFLRTVYQITSRGIDRSPLGIFGTAADVALGKYGRSLAEMGASLAGKTPEAKGLVPLGERLGDNVIGGLIGAWFVNQALQGNITASGPDNPQEKKVLTAQGWQPYSIRVGDRWWSYSNWGPAAIGLSAAGAIGEAQQYRRPGADTPAIASDAFKRFAKLATEQSYLQSVGSIYKGVTDPEQYGESFVNGIAQSLVPYGSLINTVSQAGDSVQRRPEKGDIAGAVASRIPGLRQQQPAAKDVFGNDVPNPYQGLRSVSPVRVSAEPPSGTATIRRFLGSDSAAMDAQIGQAIDRVEKWQNRPRENPRPSAEEMRLWQRFHGRDNPRYSQLLSRAASQQRQAHVGR